MAQVLHRLVAIKAGGKTVLERAIAVIKVRGKGDPRSGWGGTFEVYGLPAGADLTKVDGLEMLIEGGGNLNIVVCRRMAVTLEDG